MIKSLNSLKVLPNNCFKMTTRASLSSSLWDNVSLAPPDKILGLTEAFKKDTFPKKVNLGVGAYRTDEGKPLVLPSIKSAEEIIFNKKIDKEYAPISGVASFVQRSLEFGYGMNSPALSSNRIAGLQSISGTGALRVAGEFLKKFLPDSAIYLPNPTWGNHQAIFTRAQIELRTYPYYNPETNSVDFAKLKEAVLNAPSKSIFLLHACAHNPTGCDLTHSQWDELSSIIKDKNHVVLFDSAYQGFASGDPEKDAYAIRKFEADGHSFFLCQSYAKNFGLYGERVGLLSAVAHTTEEKERILSQLKIIARPMYSSPPIHGALIVSEVLSNPELKAKWLNECKQMADRIISMRSLLREKLETKTGKNWSHITDQIGMFCFTGLTKEQVLRLREEFHIYCTDDGRFSVAGINSTNIDYLAESVAEIVK